MELVVTKAAANHMIDQVKLNPGDAVAVSGRRKAPGKFVIDYQCKKPDQPVAQYRQSGHIFYVEFADEWFFSGKVTTVDYQDGQLTYRSVKESGGDQPVSLTNQPAKSTTDASTAASRKYEDYWE